MKQNLDKIEKTGAIVRARWIKIDKEQDERLKKNGSIYCVIDEQPIKFLPFEGGSLPYSVLNDYEIDISPVAIGESEGREKYILYIYKNGNKFNE